MGTRRAEVVIKLKTDGEAAAKRALRGIVKESAKASADMDRTTAQRIRNEGSMERLMVRIKAQAEAAKSREATKSKRSQEKDAKDLTRAQAKEKAIRDTANAKAADKERREAEKLTAKEKAEGAKRTRDHEKALAERLRLSERAFQQEARAMQRGMRESNRRGARQQRERARGERERARGNQNVLEGGDMIAQGAMGAVGAMGGAIIGVGAQRSSQFAGWRNLEDNDAVMATIVETRNQLQTIATNSGKDVEQLQNLAERAAGARGINPAESVAALGVIQDVFADQFDAITSNWDSLTAVSAGFGAELTGVAATGATLMQRFGINEGQVDDAVAITAASTGRGTVNMNQLASEFGGVPPLLAAMFGQDVQGLRGAQQFSAFSQVSGKSGLPTAAEQATATERFLMELGDPATWDALQSHGVNVTQGQGANRRLMAPEQVMQALATAPQLNEAGVLQDVFQSIPAQQYMRGLQGAGGLGLYQEMSHLTPEAGNELTQRHLGNKANDEAWRARMDQGGRQAALLDRSQDLFRTARERTGYAENFRTKHADTLGAGVAADAAVGIEEFTALMNRMMPATSFAGQIGISHETRQIPSQLARFFLGAPEEGGTQRVTSTTPGMSTFDPAVNFARQGSATLPQQQQVAVQQANAEIERGLALLGSALESTRRTQDTSTGRLITALNNTATALRERPPTGTNTGERPR